MAGDLRTAVTALLIEDLDDAHDVSARLSSLLYGELREMAHVHLRRERQQHTLNTTALVHEAFLKLVDQTRITDKGRTYFFGAASRAMRQILVDYARRRMRLKRGGKLRPLSLDDQMLAVDEFASELVDLDEALNRLSERNARQAQVVECRFFGGLNMEETAEVLAVSSRTVKRDWVLAKAWLFMQLGGG